MLSQDRFERQAPKGFQKNDAQGNDAHCKLNMLDQPFFKWFPKSLTWTFSRIFVINSNYNDIDWQFAYLVS